jgi:hypothetical protein
MCDRETGSFASPPCSGFAVFVAIIGTYCFHIGKMLPSADVCTQRQRERRHWCVMKLLLNLCHAARSARRMQLRSVIRGDRAL